VPAPFGPSNLPLLRLEQRPLPLGKLSHALTSHRSARTAFARDVLRANRELTAKQPSARHPFPSTTADPLKNSSSAACVADILALLLYAQTRSSVGIPETVSPSRSAADFTDLSDPFGFRGSSNVEKAVC